MKIPLESLYLEHEPHVRWLLRARGIPESVLDDLVHDTFVVAYRRWDDRDPQLPVGQWITGVARNVAFSHRRSEARRRRRSRALPERAAPALPDDIVAEREALTALRSFTATLSPKLRETFLLTDLAGIGVRQVARDLGLPAATVQSRRRLARARFERYFNGRAIDPARVRATAAQSGALGDERRQQQLAAITTSVGMSLVPASAMPWAWLGLGLAAAGLGVATVRARTPPPNRTEVTMSSAPHQPGPSADPISPPTTPPPSPVSVAATLSEPPSEPIRPTAPRPSAPSDPLEHDLRLLERAKADLEAGNPHAAMKRLRQTPLAGSTLRVERERLMLRAACDANDPKAAERATQSLRQLGASAQTCSDGEENQ